MINKQSAFRAMSGVMAIAFTGVAIVPAYADNVELKKGTDVHLIFDSSLNSKYSKPGDTVYFHVADPVEVDGQTVIAPGTKVKGVIEKINKRGRYGYNANVQMHMDSIRSVTGQRIMLEPKNKGQVVTAGTTTGSANAAAATAAGALILGPIGLAAGYFVVGKNINAHPGDKTTVEIAEDTQINVH